MHIMASSVHTDALPGTAPLPATHYHVSAGAMVVHFFVDNYMPTLHLFELRVLMLSDRYVIMPILHFIERRLRARMHIAWQYLFCSVGLVRRRPLSERQEEYSSLLMEEAEDILRCGLSYTKWRRRWGRFRTITTRIKGILGE